MTIAKGQPWGETVPRPDGLRLASDDAELASSLAADPSSPVAVASGDVFRTVGGRPLADRSEVQSLPIDLVRVRLDDGVERSAVAHLTATLPGRRGGWLRGEVLVVLNAEFIGALDLAPRGHPNDGRVETLLLAAGTSLRTRLSIRRRARTGTHLPHPAITTRSVRSATWHFERPMLIRLDGVAVGTSTTVDVHVEADAGQLFA